MIQYRRRICNQLINIEKFVFQLPFLLPVLLPPLQRCRCQFQFCTILPRKNAPYVSLPSSSQAWGVRQLVIAVEIPLRYQFQCPNLRYLGHEKSKKMLLGLELQIVEYKREIPRASPRQISETFTASFMTNMSYRLANVPVFFGKKSTFYDIVRKIPL